ncbi:hypothetical protein HK102_011209, partial [Quaeritorhiza haematococci]
MNIGMPSETWVGVVRFILQHSPRELFVDNTGNVIKEITPGGATAAELAKTIKRKLLAKNVPTDWKVPRLKREILGYLRGQQDFGAYRRIRVQGVRDD